MIVPKLKEFLDEQQIEYSLLPHMETFTAQETAEVAHVHGNELAKTVMVKIDGQIAMAVLPANYNVDFIRLQEVTNATVVTLANEEEFAGMFPECEVGAMPPFGNLWNMDVYVAAKLAEDDTIFFNAGNHTELMRMSFADFEQLVHPHIGEFSRA